MFCTQCPRQCNIDRSRHTGFCGMGDRPVVAKAYLHLWEEPCISGSRGSGTVFFSGCNLKCVFCQNYAISQENKGKAITVDALSEIFIGLKLKGAHNINLVNPSHFTVQIRDAIELSKGKGLDVPIVYNSGAYDSLKQLAAMDGTVDIYLPDIKYVSKDVSARYSGAEDYFEKASAAVLEMYRQTGPTVFDGEGLLKKGLIIRHLILPGHTGEAIRILDWIRANLPEQIVVSVMSQYIPCHKAVLHPEINRRLTRREFDKVISHFCKLDFKYGYFQERDSAAEEYIPDFDFEGV